MQSCNHSAACERAALDARTARSFAVRTAGSKRHAIFVAILRQVDHYATSSSARSRAMSRDVIGEPLGHGCRKAALQVEQADLRGRHLHRRRPWLPDRTSALNATASTRAPRRPRSRNSNACCPSRPSVVDLCASGNGNEVGRLPERRPRAPPAALRWRARRQRKHVALPHPAASRMTFPA